MGRKYTQEEAEAIMRAAGFEPEGEYVNNNTPWVGKWIDCGHEGSPKLATATSKNHGCFTCSRSLGAQASGAKRGEATRRRLLEGSDAESIIGFDYYLHHSKAAADRGYRVMRVLMLCPLCEVVRSVPVSAWESGRRCSCISQSGYRVTKPGTLYLLARVKEGVEERQYGISNDLKRRMSEHKRHNWTLVDKQSHKDGGVIQRREARIKRAMKLAGVYPFQYSGEKFTGFTEAWTERMLEPFDSLPELNAWAIATIASHKETDGKRE